MSSAPDSDSDAAVIERSRSDPAGFAVIFDRHAAHIKRYLARRLGPQIAEDTLAETFLVAFSKRAAYDLSRPEARPWLYGIATNLVSRHRRAEAREYQLRASLSPQTEDNHADRVAAMVTAQAGNALLAKALTELNDGERDVLLLVAWEGLNYEEVAAALDVPVGTVRSRLNRGRRKVRSVLAPESLPEEISNHG